MRAFCLSIHAGYACAHSGACCTAGWPIPIERERLAAIGLRARVPVGATGEPAAGEGGGADLLLGTGADGACVFFDAAGGRLCAIHRDAGEALLPSACRNFPRVALRDGRGLFVTLSHYCPTAAGLLLDAGEIAIVEAPSSLTLSGQVEGLEAADVMPPLLRPGMLADLDGYAAWERTGIAVLNERQFSPERAVAIIAAATAEACAWSPGGDTLAERVTHAFDRARDQRPRQEEGAAGPLDHATKAFLAAHFFASWAAYQGGGLTAVVDGFASLLAAVGSGRADAASFIAAVRAADLRVRHTMEDHVRPRPLPALRRH